MNELRKLRIDDVDDASRRAAELVTAQAARAGLVDVAYATAETPVGVLIFATTRTGLVRVAFPEEGLEHVLDDLAAALSPRVLENPRMTDPVRRELDAYFEGGHHAFRAAIDWSLISGRFSRRVLEETARIPFGSVSTYGDVAGRAGSPRAARAAGNALHDNPVPIVVPCHRVVPSSGGIGKYGGNEWRKAYLLRLEGALAE